MSTTGAIYGLKDPLTGELRYVGKTIAPLPQRLGQHLRDKKKSHKFNWIRSLRCEGHKPEIILISGSIDIEILDAAEIFWIRYFRQMGARLTNLTDGGDGGPGTPKPAGFSKKLPQLQKGYPRPWLFGRPASQETREKMSQAARARTDVRGGFRPGAPKAKGVIDSLGVLYSSVGEAARVLGVDRAAIRRVLKGQKKTSCGRTFRYVEG